MGSKRRRSRTRRCRRIESIDGENGTENLIANPSVEMSVLSSSGREENSKIHEESQKSGQSPALLRSNTARGTASSPQASGPTNYAGTAIQWLILIARMALEVPKVDASGQPIAKADISHRWSWREANDLPIWSWHLPKPRKLEYGPLKAAVTEVWAQVHLSDDDLLVLAKGMLWATCVGNQEFLHVWNDLATEQTGSRGDSLIKFKEELIRFIYRYLHDRRFTEVLSPLHYAVLRNSESFQVMLLDLLSSISDKTECFEYIRWSPLEGLAFTCSADCVFGAQPSEDSFPLMQSYLQRVSNILASLPSAPMRSYGSDSCDRRRYGYLTEFAPLSILYCLAVHKEGNFPEMWSSIFDLSSGFIKNFLLGTSSPVHKLTPLQVAVISGNTTAVTWLLKLHQEAKVNITSLDCGKRTALHWALYETNEEMVKFLVQHADDTKQPLNATVEDCDHKTPVATALDWISSSGNVNLGDFLLKAPVQREIDERYRDRQVYIDAANAKLVGAALIASITFASWLQPPLGYVPYDRFPVDSSIPDEYKSFAAIEQELRIKAFWVFNCLSFFFAMATVLTGAGSVLPRDDLFITAAVKRLNRWLMATSVLLTISIVCGLGAFTAAGLAALPPILSLELYMIVPATVGMMVCLTIVLCYVGGVVKVLISKQRRKLSSGCNKDTVQHSLQVLRFTLKTLQLLRVIITLERLEYLHSVAVQIDCKLKHELQTTPRAGVDEIDKQFNKEVESRLKCCIASTTEDVTCKSIEVRGGSFYFGSNSQVDENDVSVFEYFKKQRGEVEAEREKLLAEVEDESNRLIIVGELSLLSLPLNLLHVAWTKFRLLIPK